MINSWNPDMYSKAWDFATLAHEGQTYGGPKDGIRIPYINHIASVAMEMTLALVNTDEKLNANLAVQCALLHDVIEDTAIDYDEISKIFGVDVADGVQALSKNEQLPTKHEQMKDSIARIKKQPKEIWMVKLADRITNLYHPPFYWNAEKILNYRDEANYILAELGESNAILYSRLQKKIADYAAFAQ